jgi:hypothetical protein
MKGAGPRSVDQEPTATATGTGTEEATQTTPIGQQTQTPSSGAQAPTSAAPATPKRVKLDGDKLLAWDRASRA